MSAFLGLTQMMCSWPLTFKHQMNNMRDPALIFLFITLADWDINAQLFHKLKLCSLLRAELFIKLPDIDLRALMTGRDVPAFPYSFVKYQVICSHLLH